MKVDLIGMLFNNGAKRCFKEFIGDDDGKFLTEHQALDFMIMEYAKVKNGGTSDYVVVRNLQKDITQ